MSTASTLPIDLIDAAFGRQIAELGGEVHHRWNRDGRLYLRSVLPGVEEVLPGDGLQGGVALRAVDETVRVHPYLFRLICKNGAIMPHTLGTTEIEGLAGLSPHEVESRVRDAVRACAARSIFTASLAEMRDAATMNFDVALTLESLLGDAPDIVEAILLSADPHMDAFLDLVVNPERSTAFDLLNTVTAAARDEDDPERRWRLEELGGGLPALLRRTPRRFPPAAAAAAALPSWLNRETVLAGFFSPRRAADLDVPPAWFPRYRD